MSQSRFARIGAAGAVVATLGAGTTYALAGHDDAEPASAPLQTATETPNLALRQNNATSRELSSTRPPLRATSKPPARKPSASPTTAKATKVAKAAPAPKPKVKVVPKAIGSKYATVALNIRTGAGKHFLLIDQLGSGDKVAVTGVKSGEWSQVLVDKQPGWVASKYLSTAKPKAQEGVSGGVSSAACSSGSGVEDGVSADTIRVHRAVCALFPGVKSYGGLRGGGGFHAEGRALDIMIGSDQTLGKQIADWVRAHAKELGVSEVIWAQHIWTVQRGGEGWRAMEDRGSTTANHYDHVHVSTYGSSGTA